jgi:hypothetical protein
VYYIEVCAVVAAERVQPLSKEELEVLRLLIKRMLGETDRRSLRTLIEELRRIVENDPPEVRPN